MATIQLSAYIQNWLILHNIAVNNLYQCVVFEHFTNSDFELPKNVVVISLSKAPWASLDEKMKLITQKYQSIAVVLEALSWKQHYAWYQSFWASLKKLTFLDTSSGISWLPIKWYLPKDENQLISWLWMQIFDPCDVLQFFDSLNHAWSRYVMVQQWEYTSSMLEGVQCEWWLYDLWTVWVQWDTWVIITSWRVAYDVANCLTKLKEVDLHFHLFVSETAIIPFNDQLWEVVSETNTCIIIQDIAISNDKAMLSDELFTFFRELPWGSNKNLSTILPSDSITNCTLPDYIYEQAWIDIESIYLALYNKYKKVED